MEPPRPEIKRPPRELERRMRVRIAVERVIREMAEDFGVPPPKVRVVKDKEVRSLCGTPLVSACYRYQEREIVLPESGAGIPLTVLHEFAHYLQHYRAGWDTEKAFPPEEYKKPAEERSFEREAYALARALSGLYWDALIKEVEGRSREARDGRLACAYASAKLTSNMAEAALLSVEKRVGYARRGLEEADALASVLPLLCPSADADRLEKVKLRIRDALRSLERDDYVGAQHSALLGTYSALETLRKR